MCGLFGFVLRQPYHMTPLGLENALQRLFELSERRGQEAAGLALRCQNHVTVYKAAGKASSLVKSSEYKNFLSDFFRLACQTRQIDFPIAAFGHSRLVTNGWQTVNDNNQPVFSDICVGIHNGIIVNAEALWQSNPHFSRASEVDTEIAFRLFDDYRRQGMPHEMALAEVFHQIEGVANLAFFTKDTNALFLATNNGALYFADAPEYGCFAFASERDILSQALKGWNIGSPMIQRLGPNRGLAVFLDQDKLHDLSLKKPERTHIQPSSGTLSFHLHDGRTKQLRRCTRCILPESFPGIHFDSAGVCSVCNGTIAQKPFGKSELLELVEPFRRHGDADCIVAVSGGRDSSYGLHYLKRELGLNPIAFTYDWGMVTDLARRNVSRLCAKLGVEHIIRSADIPAKRRNIRVNIEAWLRRPDLGMIPLFMAGDKMFYHHGRNLRKQLGIDLVFFCAGNLLERTEFKSGFCGVRESQHGQVLWKYSLWNKISLALFYAKNFALNPAYLNRSLLDTMAAYWSTYVAKDDFIYLYHYIPWNEDEISSVLCHEYGWEEAGDSATTWRIGDGTAAFYNYIYHTVAGFSEHDTFRSNQVRSGLIDREEALALAERDNAPRWQAMRDYASVVGFSLEEALSVINSIPKLYGA